MASAAPIPEPPPNAPVQATMTCHASPSKTSCPSTRTRTGSGLARQRRRGARRSRRRAARSATSAAARGARPPGQPAVAMFTNGRPVREPAELERPQLRPLAREAAPPRRSSGSPLARAKSLAVPPGITRERHVELAGERGDAARSSRRRPRPRSDPGRGRDRASSSSGAERAHVGAGHRRGERRRVETRRPEARLATRAIRTCPRRYTRSRVRPHRPHRGRGRRPRVGDRAPYPAPTACRSCIARRSRSRASRPCCSTSARATSSCSRRSCDDTPVGRFLAARGPGLHHVAYQVDDVERRARRGARGGAAADRRDAAHRHPRNAGRVPAPRDRRRRPDRARPARGGTLSSNAVRRTAVGFQGGQVLSLRLPEEVLDQPARDAQRGPRALGGGRGLRRRRARRHRPGRRTSALNQTSTASVSDDRLARPGQCRRSRALPARAARSRTRRTPSDWVRRYSHLGEHGAVWLGGGARGALVDRRRRRRWLRATAAVGAAYATSTSIKLAVGRKRPAIEDLPHLMATPTGLSFPSSHATSSFAAARAFGALVPGRAAAARGRRDGASAASTSASTTRPTSPPARRSAPLIGSLGDDEGRPRGDAQRGQVLAVQRAQPGRRRGRELPVHDDRAERRRRAGQGRAHGAGGGDGRRLQHRLGHDRVPRHRRAWSPARPRARASATSSWPTSASATRCCTSSAPTPTRTSSTPRAGSTRRADIETIETELLSPTSTPPSAATRGSSATPARATARRWPRRSGCGR